MMVDSLRETDLFLPIRDYLIAQGYEVNAEVKNCDITAVKGGELVIIEMKTHFNATLLIQAADRQRIADAVYIALPHPADFRRQKNWRGMCHLLKRLEMGLILVHFLKSGPRVEISFHPLQQSERKNKKKRSTILREIHDRSAEYNIGGTGGESIVTSYREAAIEIAYLLDTYGHHSPAELRKRGTGRRTQSILSNNFYGWFERVERGVYKLHSDGKKAIGNYPEIVDYYKKRYK